MTNKEALEVFHKREACNNEICIGKTECARCQHNYTEGELSAAMDLAKKTLEDTIPKFHLQCLLCKGYVGVYSTHTMEHVGYTNYSYCEDCLRKGLKLLKETMPEEISIGDEVERTDLGVKGIVYMIGEDDVAGVVEAKETFCTFVWDIEDVKPTGRHFREVKDMIRDYDVGG